MRELAKEQIEQVAGAGDSSYGYTPHSYNYGSSQYDDPPEPTRHPAHPTHPVHPPHPIRVRPV